MLDQVGGVEGSAPSYPPYNIARTGENDYRISVAVAGFTEADLAIEAKENTLTLRGEKHTNDEEKSCDVLYQGIAARNFERSFQPADHVQVKGASLENGLLHIDLVREIPEAMKPRAIPIASSSKVLEAQPTKLAAQRSDWMKCGGAPVVGALSFVRSAWHRPWRWKSSREPVTASDLCGEGGGSYPGRFLALRLKEQRRLPPSARS